MFVSQLYQELGDMLFSTELQNFLQAENLPAVAHYDFYEKQPFREAAEIAYHLPAVFLEIRLTDSQTIAGGGVQEQYTIKLHIESLCIGSTARNSHNQAESLSHIKFTEAIKLFLAKKIPVFRISGLSFDQKGKRNPVHIIELQATITQKIC